MPALDKSILNEILKELNNAEGIIGSAIVTRDGLVIASQLPENVDSATFAAMSAAMTGAAETAISELKKGLVDRVIVESKQAKIITIGAGSEAILVTLTGKEARLGLILIEMKKAAEKIR